MVLLEHMAIITGAAFLSDSFSSSTCGPNYIHTLFIAGRIRIHENIRLADGRPDALSSEVRGNLKRGLGTDGVLHFREVQMIFSAAE